MPDQDPQIPAASGAAPPTIPSATPTPPAPQPVAAPAPSTDDLQSQIGEARKQGYSDDEILGHLSTKSPSLAPKITEATSSGYKAGEILDHLGQKQPDAFQKAVNYRTGNDLIDAPLGVVQGAAKGMAELGEDVGGLTRKLLGKPQASQEQKDLDTKPNGVGQGTGKFLEQAAEFALPAGKVAKATEGANLAIKAGAQALTSGAMGALQSHGDVGETALDAGLGAAGEVIPAAISGVKALAKNAQPTLGNFGKSFVATPTQKKAISKALPTLLKDGVKPAENLEGMHGVIQDQLQKLSSQYDKLPSDIADRELDAQKIIDGLKEEQKAYTHGSTTTTEEVKTGLVDERGKPVTKTVTTETPFVSNANKEYYNKFQNEIEDIQKLAVAREGKVSFDDLRHMRDGANGRTNFQSPDAEQNLYRQIGDVYRSGMDRLAPETTQLNKDWAQYKSLDKVAQTNKSMGKGEGQSAFVKGIEKATAPAVGAELGFAAGHAVGGAPGGFVGSLIGTLAYPKISSVAKNALKNAIDSGKVSALPKARQSMLLSAAKVGDNKGIMNILGLAKQVAKGIPQASVTDRDNK